MSGEKLLGKYDTTDAIAKGVRESRARRPCPRQSAVFFFFACVSVCPPSFRRGSPPPLHSSSKSIIKDVPVVQIAQLLGHHGHRQRRYNRLIWCRKRMPDPICGNNNEISAPPTMLM